VHWILTGMLVVASLATAVYTGYLMRRLFTLEPGAPDVADEVQPALMEPAQTEPAQTERVPAEPAPAQPAAAQE
jgi:hypothetical protein